MTKLQRALVKDFKGLMDTHDTVEAALVILTRDPVGEDVLAPLWKYHDDIERAIIGVAAELPQRLMERLKRGEL
jgi:hypothetical protein